MKPSAEVYETIKPLPPPGTLFTHFPGVYCLKCGEVFALYSYSAIAPSGVDENGKPYMRGCPKCEAWLPTIKRSYSFGFTLIELLAVITIIGLVSIFAIPAVLASCGQMD